MIGDSPLQYRRQLTTTLPLSISLSPTRSSLFLLLQASYPPLTPAAPLMAVAIHTSANVGPPISSSSPALLRTNSAHTHPTIQHSSSTSHRRFHRRRAGKRTHTHTQPPPPKANTRTSVIQNFASSSLQPPTHPPAYPILSAHSFAFSLCSPERSLSSLYYHHQPPAAAAAVVVVAVNRERGGGGGQPRQH